jgi:predicted small lipoprotein YifL
LDRRQFTLLALAAGLAAGVSACGRRGPLEPPPYTAQGQEWARRSGRTQQQGAAAPQGSVRDAVAEEEIQRGTVDVEGQVERNRSEGEPQAPSDPTQASPAQNVTPTGGRRRPPGIVPPKRSFILDPLLE